MQSYRELTGLLPDFRVTYSIYSAEEGGRKTPALQHIRWDFRYDEKAIATGTFMIWPEVLLLSEEMLPDGFIPPHGLADMFILFPARRAFHQQHIKLGTRGYFMEGGWRVAVCEVVELLGLYTNPVV
jgi:hypothetical protein